MQTIYHLWPGCLSNILHHTQNVWMVFCVCVWLVSIYLDDWMVWHKPGTQSCRGCLDTSGLSWIGLLNGKSGWIPSGIAACLPPTRKTGWNLPSLQVLIHCTLYYCLLSDLWSFLMLSHHHHLKSCPPPHHCQSVDHVIGGRAPHSCQLQLRSLVLVAVMQTTTTKKTETVCSNL